jgi:RNA polymerase sigma-70 factor (ECF subfamily)
MVGQRRAASLSSGTGRMGEEVVKRHAAQLFRLALCLTHDESDARDLVQDTWERGLRKLPAQLPEGCTGRWLGVTLREPPWARVDSGQLSGCVARLKPVLREVFWLRTRDRHSHAEIARRLDIPATTAATRYFRALRHLRRLLEQEIAGPRTRRPALVRTPDDLPRTRSHGGVSSGTGQPSGRAPPTRSHTCPRYRH